MRLLLSFFFSHFLTKSRTPSWTGNAHNCKESVGSTCKSFCCFSHKHKVVIYEVAREHNQYVEVMLANKIDGDLCSSLSVRQIKMKLTVLHEFAHVHAQQTSSDWKMLLARFGWWLCRLSSMGKCSSCHSHSKFTSISIIRTNYSTGMVLKWSFWVQLRLTSVIDTQCTVFVKAWYKHVMYSHFVSITDVANVYVYTVMYVCYAHEGNVCVQACVHVYVLCLHHKVGNFF